MIHGKFNNFNVHLVESVEELEIVKNVLTEGVDCSIDTETDGLDFNRCSIAGVCVSGGKAYSEESYHGFYIPVRHYGYSKNLPIDKVVEFTQWVLDNRKVCFWNRNFDNTMLEKEGVNIPVVGKTHDIQIMAHLIANEPFPPLKDFAERLLKFNVIHYSDNNAESNDFKTTDPTVSFIYAAGDPILTALLGRKIWMDYPYIRKIYPLDNMFAEILRRFTQKSGLYLDKNTVQKLLDDNLRKQNELKKQIFNMCGYQFRLTAASDKADALSRFVTLTVKTKSGKWDTSEEVLSQIDHPLAKLLIDYAHLEKFRNTYLQKMSEFPQPFYVNYKHCDVATGRLSSGASRGNDFFAPLNIQNIPKIEVIKHLHWAPVSCPFKWHLINNPNKPLGKSTPIMTSNGPRPLHTIKPGDIVKTPKGDKHVLEVNAYHDEMKLVKQGSLSLCDGAYIKRDGEDWKRTESTVLSEDVPYELILEDDTYSVCIPHGAVQIKTLQHAKCKAGIREAFIPTPSDPDDPDPWVWLSADYSSQEMVVQANLSREPFLIEPLLSGEDIHKYVAIKMFGHYDKTKRTAAKGLNFACAYGAGPSTIAEANGLDFEGGKALLDKYNQTLSKAYAWRQMNIKEARRKGMIFSYFGRPRMLAQYYSSSDKSKWAFADRCAQNSPIQGTGGDIIRQDFIKYYKRLHSDKEFAEKTRFINTVHDEINMSVRVSYISKAFQVLREIMEIHPSNWIVPLKVSPSIGTT